MSSRSVRLFHTPLQECPYLPGEVARNRLIDPDFTPTPGHYQQLTDLGYRRSGSMLYRPDCPHCRQCIPCRVEVAAFRPNRKMRRLWSRNQPIDTHTRDTRFHDDHYALFMKYLAHRHPDGLMSQSSPEEYLGRLATPWGETCMQEFRRDGQLMAVAVMDRLPMGLSAIYTFFDPEFSHLSPGVLAVLWQIAQAKRLGLSWVYLGYWIEKCRKMAYKREYQPLQLFEDGQWREFS